MRILLALVALIVVLISVSGCATVDATTGASPVEETDADIKDSVQPLEKANRVLVVYFSQGSGTRQVASDLAAVMHADLEVIEELRERRGFCGFLRAGGASTFKIASRIAPGKLDPSCYDVVYVCTPVWAWSLSPPVRAWLKAHHGRIRKAAFVTVSSDTQPGRIAKDMARTAGIEPFAVAGFSERDFYAENRAQYEAKIAALVEPLR